MRTDGRGCIFNRSENEQTEVNKGEWRMKETMVLFKNKMRRDNASADAGGRRMAERRIMQARGKCRGEG
jgi:hypothetical protein